MKYAELKPNLPASLFPAPKPKASAVRTNHALKDRSTNNPSMNTSRRRSIEDERSSQAVFGDDMDEFDDDGLDDGDFVAAGKSPLHKQSFAEALTKCSYSWRSRFQSH